MKNYLTSTLVLFLFLASISPLSAQDSQSITVSKIPPSYNGAQILAVGTDGSTSSALIENRRATVEVGTDTVRLYLRKDGEIAGIIASPFCKRKGKKCSKKNLVLAAKAGKRIRLGKEKNGILLAKGKKKKLQRSFDKSVREKRNVIVASVSSSGLAANLQSQNVSLRAVEELDEDNDGLVDLLDADDDGDGILDNYDSDSSSGEGEGFRVFSNFKLDIDQTINLHATGIKSDELDERLASTQTLAIEVAAEDEETAELDCTGLTYCTTGGSGVKLDGNTNFPGTLGGENDVDGDGFGELEEGMTGDFQLRTGATSSEIGGGDTYIQYVSDGTTETEIPGMLNFVFNSTPALISLAVNEEEIQTVDYESEQILGSRANCFEAPATGEISVALEGWRPQRPGIAAAGEGDFVDLGNSLITADIPNVPCLLGDSCTGNGPGNCAVSSYSTDDENLSIESDGLRDGKGDIDADETNTYSFTVDLSNCLDNAPSGSLTWDAGETLFVDLQFRSTFGDNAAQKFCITRADS
ncbi:hypothetical protein MRY87_00700 [bacterium]|nr:hypothetical protein [bacterium]